ncbi:putative uncharacterized protein DDB_G0282133 [Cotesia glomerata]|uniref:putative uncharacterized protein DDB_G0282133 n=1 Tax=Cotesia glomerata TaxID=32391 RepID=UPI001D001B52|nr:putative uncharacterized protein DDB_G0282133 [Cotesia glomerata]
MDLIFSLVILFVQFHIYSCQARNKLCDTNDYFQERERDRRREVPVRRQYVISDENGKFDQYSDLQESDINFPDHDYSFEVVEEDDTQNPNYHHITDNENENIPSFAIEPRFSRKTSSQTSPVFSHGARHLHHRHSKKYYPHTEEIIIVTPSESQNRQYYLRGIQVPTRGRRNNLHRHSPNNNINVNTNSYSKSDSVPQHLSEDVSLSKPQLIGELIDQESNLEKPQPLTNSVPLLEILNNDQSINDRQNSKNNNVNVDTNVNERAYLSRRHTLDENKNFNDNVNSNIDDYDERDIGPAVIVSARKNFKLLGLNRRDIDALRTERRSRNQNDNTNVNSNDAGYYLRPEPIPAPVFTDRNVPYIILDAPHNFVNAAYRNKNQNKNVNVNTNDIDSREYY